MITLSKDNAVRIVATEEQALKLEALGYVRTSGSAESSPSMAKGTYPYSLEDVTNPHTPYNRGIAFEGEGATVGKLVKSATRGATQEQLEFLKKTFSAKLDTAVGSFTEILKVNALPTSSQSATKIYLLLKDDATAQKSKGAYKWVSNAWATF